MLATEPIGSVPRPPELIAAVAGFAGGRLSAQGLERAYAAAVRDTIRRFEATGSRILTDGEQGKPSFATYPIAGAANLAPDGLVVTFSDGHTRTLPRLTGGPFRYQRYAEDYLRRARRYTKRPLKQAVISASLLATFYPAAGIPDYPRGAFLEDVVREVVADIRRCLRAGAYVVQMDFTEAPLAVKLDPSGQLLKDFVALNNQVFARFSGAERGRLGVHVCKGGDQDATHSAEVDYAQVFPRVFELTVPRFYFAVAGEPDRPRTLQLLREYATGKRRVFVGVTNPISREVETPAEVERRVAEAAKYIDVDHLGTTDDCGFAPFGDDTSTSRDLAFAKIQARIAGTRLASRRLSQ